MSFLPSPGSSADDRETPLVAVEDILPVLLAAADASRKLLSDISIYDPYYCRGAVKSHLISLGCSPGGVHNDPIDCYTAQKANEVPAFDVLLSNPPYSGDHIQRCVHYAVASSKPWALLLPSNVFLRPWFEKAVKDQTVWFLAPHERYGFLNDSARNSAAENHVPFVTMWFIGGLNISSRGVLRDRWLQSSRNTASTLAVSPQELPRRIKKLLPFTKVQSMFIL